MSADVHEVYALRYAHHDRHASENYVFGDPHDIIQPLAYFVWVIRGAHGTFVMDTGFDRAMAAKRGRVIVKPLADGLPRSMGLRWGALLHDAAKPATRVMRDDGEVGGFPGHDVQGADLAPLYPQPGGPAWYPRPRRALFFDRSVHRTPEVIIPYEVNSDHA